MKIKQRKILDQIEVEILSKKCPFAEKKLRQFVFRVLIEIHKKDFGVCVFIVNSARMKALHMQHFGDPSDTDSMSFSQLEGKMIGRSRLLGDVFVCWDQVKRQAPKYANTAKEELLYCLIHGILHLVGYEDTTAKLKEKMFKLQNQIHQRVSSEFL